MTTGGGTSRPRPRTGARHPPVSRTTVFWYAFVTTLLVGWFLFGWLILRQGFVDSVGEALGTGFTLLLAVSVIEAARRHRQDGMP
ncbi:hypothetical protein ACN27F_21065 [Solwaraspora sp. WMMB335]|uniref:hypothetical protein n=1 Tax=Solwaraspora sp. WMMB335 TaxID=3404118 RepID=UPI003B953F32